MSTTDTQATVKVRERAQAEREARYALAAEAGRERRAACARLLDRVTAGDLPQQVVTEIFADTMLAVDNFDAFSVCDVMDNVAQWCGATVTEDITEHEFATWLAGQTAVGGPTALRAAIAICLAIREDALTPGTYRWRVIWPLGAVRHVQRLVDHAGHQLSPHEQDQLAAAQAADKTVDKAEILDDELPAVLDEVSGGATA